MANSPEVQKALDELAKKNKRPATWQEKLDLGAELSPMDEVRADADYNHNKRVKDQADRDEFEARKRGDRRSTATDAE